MTEFQRNILNWYTPKSNYAGLRPKNFLTRVAVSYAFFRASNGKNSGKVPARIIFSQISIFDFGTQ